jgi:hypothetical protein
MFQTVLTAASTPTTKRIANAILFAFIAWASTRLYAHYCAPAGLYGFLQSFITMDSTLCKVVFAIISHTQVLYGAALATLFYAFVNMFRSKTTPGTPIPQVGRGSQRRVSDSETPEQGSE